MRATYDITFICLVDGEEGRRRAEENARGVAGARRCQWIFMDQAESGACAAELYREALTQARGTYVCFTSQEVLYDRTALLWLKLAQGRKAEDVYAIGSRIITDRKNRIRRFRTYLQSVEENRARRLFLPAYFIRRELIRPEWFLDVCEEETWMFFLIGLLRAHGTAVYVDGIFCYYTDVLSQDSAKRTGRRNPDFYCRSLEEGYLPLLRSFPDGEVPVWLRELCYYNLYFKYYSNVNARDQFVLEDDRDRFFALSKELLSYVDDEIIMSNERYQQYVPPMHLRNLFLYLKYDGDQEILDRRFRIRDGVVEFSQCGVTYRLHAHTNLTVRAIDCTEEEMVIYLQYVTDLVEAYAPGCFTARIDGREPVAIPQTGLYALEKVFGVADARKWIGALRLDRRMLASGEHTIAFCLTLNGETMQMGLEFNRTPSKLDEQCPSSYWMFAPGQILCYEDRMLRTCAITPEVLAEREKRYQRELPFVRPAKESRVAQNRIYARSATRTRRAFFRAEQSGRERIWLFFDKLYKAGDNGEYAFRYAVEAGRPYGITCYYILNDDAPDYARLKEEFPENLLIYGSEECRVMALRAENIVATHPDIIDFLGFRGFERRCVKNLFNANLICIAHGVTIQKNADYQNKIYDNTMFYTTSSEYEVRHILQPVYGYSTEEVALTGMARFDGLINRDKKQILITPTWRRNLIGRAERNSTREYESSFKQTEYYRVYNTLINDERILRAAEENGYRVIFLLHPAMSAQIDDYEKNDRVEIIAASGDMSYEKNLTESSLMITDYSGIHYDFGYMRKPVIYYQPKETPMRFEEGGMKFATMGFGPVCTEYEEAVRLICEAMEQQCVMPEEYRRRADDFFAFDDHENSRRIFEAILAWTDKRRKWKLT